MKASISRTLQRVDHFIQNKLRNGMTYLVQLVISALFILPVLAANVDYIDDNARRVMGYYDWASLGRYLTEFIMHIVTISGGALLNPGRSMQLLSIPVLAYAGYVFTRSLSAKGEKKNSLIAILAGAIVIVNPFLVANLAFRFDSLSMILAYALAIIAGTMLITKDGLRSAIFSGLIIVASAALYQPMILMTAVVAIILVVKAATEKRKDGYRRLGIGLGVFVGGMGLYYLSLQLFHFASVGGASRGVLLPFNQAGLRRASENYQSGIHTIVSLFQNSVGRVWLIILAVAIIALLGICIRNAGRAKQWKKAIVFGVAPFLLAACIMGPFVLMDSALTYQVRTLAAGIGVFLLFGTLLTIAPLARAMRLVGVVLVLFGIMYGMVFSNAFGTSLALQREHDKTVYDEIDDYLLNSSEMQTVNLVYIGGQASMPTSVTTIIEKRPILKRMDVAGDNSTWYLWMQLRDDRSVTANVDWYVQSKEQEAMRQGICATSRDPIHRNPYYSVYRQGDVVTVWQHSSLVADTFCSR